MSMELSDWRPPVRLTSYYIGVSLVWFAARHRRFFPHRSVFKLADRSSIAPLPNGTKVVMRGGGSGVIRAYLGWGDGVYEVFTRGLTRCTEQWFRQVVVPIVENEPNQVRP